MTIGNPTGLQTNFFTPGSFDPLILDYAEVIGKPLAVGELLSFAGGIATVNTYAGPVLIVTGEHDLPFCGGDCYSGVANGTSIPAESQQYFPSTNISTSIIPGSGHALNLEYTHVATYETINLFLKEQV